MPYIDDVCDEVSCNLPGCLNARKAKAVGVAIAKMDPVSTPPAAPINLHDSYILVSTLETIDTLSETMPALADRLRAVIAATPIGEMMF